MEAVEDLSGLPRVRAVIGGPGTGALLAARTLGSLPIGMVPLGIILLLRASGHSYAFAGITDGAYALGLAGTQPQFGRLIDRVGMGRVLTPLALIFPALLVALSVVGSGRAPGAATVALAFGTGAMLPPLGPCMRALWPTLLPSPALRPTAFAVDAVLQELSFVIGPPLLALIVALSNPRAALFASAALGGVGAFTFATRARARHEPTVRTGGALRSADVRRLLGISVLLGGTFGATEVAVPAFCEIHGSRPAAGIVLAAVALGSACGGVIFGSRTPSISPVHRLLVALGAYAALIVPLLIAPSIAVMVPLGFLAGMPIAAVFAGTYLLLDHFAVAGAATETFAWNTTCVFGGAAVGNALGGAIIGPGGYRAAMAVSIVLGLAAVALVTTYARGERLAS
jgi:predicted MFS family arabinose efflux permease